MVLYPMTQRNGLFDSITRAISGAGNRAAPEPVAPASRPQTEAYTDDRAREQRSAGRQREAQMAVRRAQAATTRPLTEQQIATIRRRYQ